MTKEEFNLLYGHLGQKKKVLMICCCGKEKIINKEKAEENINNHNGKYVCRACSMEASHLSNPRGEETKEKQRIGRKGKKHSEESKKAMSEWRKAFYKTPEGLALRKLLSQKAAKQHANVNMDKSKVKVLYISAKNNGQIRVCSSSGEFVACEDFFEKDETIIKYETQLYYEINDRSHSLDFLLHYEDGSKKLIEIKPAKRMTEAKNVMQIEDSSAYAKQQGWLFELWTEKELKIQSWKDAKARADAYRKKHYLINYAAYREERNRQKGKRFYDNKIKQDKVITYCNFCKIYHSQLRITYNKNIKKNGKFICIKENGHIVGSKPKTYLRKENEYKDIGMKKCLGLCSRILSFESFGKDKSRTSGLADKCKECRAAENKKKYQENKRNK